MGAETVSGRWGGRRSRSSGRPVKSHMERIGCQGGPLAGTEMAIHSWGVEPVPVRVVPIPATHSRYRLAGTEILGPRRVVHPAGPYQHPGIEGDRGAALLPGVDHCNSTTAAAER